MQIPKRSSVRQSLDDFTLGVLGVHPPLAPAHSQALGSMYVCELKSTLGQAPPVPLVPLKHEHPSWRQMGTIAVIHRRFLSLDRATGGATSRAGSRTLGFALPAILVFAPAHHLLYGAVWRDRF
jgi:hypothetical protein